MEIELEAVFATYSVPFAPVARPMGPSKPVEISRMRVPTESKMLTELSAVSERCSVPFCPTENPGVAVVEKLGELISRRSVPSGAKTLTLGVEPRFPFRTWRFPFASAERIVGEVKFPAPSEATKRFELLRL